MRIFASALSLYLVVPRALAESLAERPILGFALRVGGYACSMI